MRALILLTLGVAGVAWAQTTPTQTQPDMAPPGQTAPTTPPTPGATPPQSPSSPATTPGEATPARPDGSREMMGPNQMPQASSPGQTAMTDYPVCTRQMRDRCRQPDGRRIPPPAGG